MTPTFPWADAHKGIQHTVMDPRPHIGWVSYWIRPLDDEADRWLLSVDTYLEDEDFSMVGEFYFETLRDAMAFAENYHADRF